MTGVSVAQMISKDLYTHRRDLYIHHNENPLVMNTEITKENSGK